MKRRQVLKTAIGGFAAAGAMGFSGAFAQAYPNKPITLMNPFAPGGGADVVARLLAEELRPLLGQTVLVENRPGAGGSVAAGAVARADADGYQLLFVTAGHAGMGALYPSLPFDPLNDFTPVIGVTRSPIVVAVSENSNYKTIQDLVEAAKAKPGDLNFAGGGGGATLTNLTAEVIKSELKLDVESISYPGSGPAIVALLAGEIDYDVDAAPGLLSYIQNKQIRPLAVTTATRSDILPDVPTLNETILPNFSANIWYGILAPKNTPADIIKKLNTDFNTVLAKQSVKERLQKAGSDVFGGTPEEFGSLLKSETARWGEVIMKLGLKAG